MPLLSKLKKAGDITISSINEKIKTSALKKKIKNIEKRDQNKLNEKIDIERDLDKIKNSEKEKREAIATKLKSEIKESKEKRGIEAKKFNIFRRIQKEFKNIPIVSAADDIIEGISGIENAELIVSQNPEESFAWLLLAETLKYHRKTFLKVQKLKLPIDFFGSIIDVSTEYIGDFVDKAIDKDKITYEKALSIAFNMAAGKESPSVLDLIVLGRCMQLSSQNTKDTILKYGCCEKAEKYYKMALEAGMEIEDEGEISFYLSEIYRSMRKFKEHRKLLEESKNKGFVPAQRELKKYTINKDLRIPKGIKPVDKFRYSIRKTASEEVISGASNLFNKQGKKIARVSERILDNVLDKIIK